MFCSHRPVAKHLCNVLPLRVNHAQSWPERIVPCSVAIVGTRDQAEVDKRFIITKYYLSLRPGIAIPSNYINGLQDHLSHMT